MQWTNQYRLQRSMLQNAMVGDIIHISERFYPHGSFPVVERNERGQIFVQIPSPYGKVRITPKLIKAVTPAGWVAQP